MYELIANKLNKRKSIKTLKEVKSVYKPSCFMCGTSNEFKKRCAKHLGQVMQINKMFEL